MKKEGLVVLFLLFFFGLFLGLSFTGNVSFDGVSFLDSVEKCTDLEILSVHDYYVDPEAVCAPCDDLNPGTVDQPWCTLQRAFNKSYNLHFKGKDHLYLRNGIHRFDSSVFFSLPLLPNHYLDGDANNPTLITSYPGEYAKIYASDNPKGWNRLADSDVWVFDWYNYLSKNHSWFVNPTPVLGISPTDVSFLAQKDYLSIPQAVFIEDINSNTDSLILRQANESKITEPSARSLFNPVFGMYLKDNSSFTYYKNYTLMPPGYSYYENDKKSKDFGKLFIKLPASLHNRNLNSLSVEIPLSFSFYPTGYNKEVDHLVMGNISIRYTQSVGYPFSGGFVIAGKHNTLDSIDISYHTLTGVYGYCNNCSIVNSSFRYNGNVGTALRGDNIIYENNLFLGNSWRSINPGWAAGGAKLIPSYHNFTFRNNRFINNTYVGLWLDYTGDGRAIGLNAGEKNWSKYTGAGHIIENNTFINGGLALETSPGSSTNPIIVRNNFIFGPSSPSYLADFGVQIQGTPYVYFYNNILYNLSYGVLVGLPDMDFGDGYYCAPQTCPIENLARQKSNNINISNNIFLDVSIPVSISNNSAFASPKFPKSFANISSDANIYYGAYSEFTHHSIIKKNIDFSRTFKGLKQGYPCIAAAVPIHDPARCFSYIVDSYAIDKDQNPGNGKSPGIYMTKEVFDFYKNNNLENLQKTPFFKTAFFGYSYVHPTWEVFKISTLAEWKATTHLDSNSFIQDPKLTIHNDYSFSFADDSPAFKIGFTQKPKQNTSLSIIYPENKNYSSIINSLNYLYQGPSLVSCRYSLDQGLTNFTFSCSQNITNIQSKEGTNHWTIFISNIDGRVSNKNTTFFVDSLYPVISNINASPQSPANYSSQGTYNFTAIITDNNAIIVNLSFNGQQYYPKLIGNKYLVNFSKLTVGNYTYSWTAKDSFGHLTSTQNYTYIIVEQKLETFNNKDFIFITYPENKNSSSIITNLNYTVSSTLTNCSYSLNEGITNFSIICGTNISNIASKQGRSKWTVFAKNFSRFVFNSSVEFFIDSIPPEVYFINPTPLNNSDLDNEDLIINVSANDSSLYNIDIYLSNYLGIVVSSSSRNNPHYISVESLPSGTYFFNSTAKDSFGNKNSTTTRTIIINNSQRPEVVELRGYNYSFSQNEIVSGILTTLVEKDSFNFNFDNKNYRFLLSDVSSGKVTFIYNGQEYYFEQGRSSSIVLNSNNLYLTIEPRLININSKLTRVYLRLSERSQQSQSDTFYYNNVSNQPDSPQGSPGQSAVKINLNDKNATLSLTQRLYNILFDAPGDKPYNKPILFIIIGIIILILLIIGHFILKNIKNTLSYFSKKSNSSALSFS